VRLILRAAAIVLGLIVCVPLHYLWRLSGSASPWPPRFLGWVARCAGMRVRIAGTPLRRDVLFVANHLSWLDILLLGSAARAAFVSKEEVARWPLVGWLAGLNNTIFVARSARGAVAGQVDALRAALATGQPVALFPEGTTDGGTEVLPFRPSLLASTMPPLPGLKVQPVAIDYGPAGAEIAWIGDESAAANARRILSRKRTVPVTLTFLAPVDPHGAPNRKVLAEAARGEILAALAASAGAPDRL
jgi:1-acyl-sn-glycerol-3-phosphate acyltransferase